MHGSPFFLAAALAAGCLLVSQWIATEESRVAVEPSPLLAKDYEYQKWVNVGGMSAQS